MNRLYASLRRWPTGCTVAAIVPFLCERRPDGTAISWNRAAERVQGYKVSEILGRSVPDLVHPEEHAAIDDGVCSTAPWVKRRIQAAAFS
jgi:PAS domain S-box-containing protein